MKNQILLYLLCAVLLCACNSNGSTSSDLSDFEEEINKQLHTIYKSKATVNDVYSQEINNFEYVDLRKLTVNQSPTLDSLPLSTSVNNITTIAYENLSPEEREKFQYIAIAIEQTGKAKDDDYLLPIETLSKIAQSKQIAYQFGEGIKSANYKDVTSIIFDEEGIEQKLENYFTDITNDYGKIVNYYIYGIGEGVYESKIYYTFTGNLIYSNGLMQKFYINIFGGENSIFEYNFFPVTPK